MATPWATINHQQSVLALCIPESFAQTFNARVCFLCLIRINCQYCITPLVLWRLCEIWQMFVYSSVMHGCVYCLVVGLLPTYAAAGSFSRSEAQMKDGPGRIAMSRPRKLRTCLASLQFCTRSTNHLRVLAGYIHGLEWASADRLKPWVASVCLLPSIYYG